jgi:hypothetical protein
VEGSCEHGNEPSGSIKVWEIPELLHNWWLLKKGSATCVSDLFINIHKQEYLSHFPFRSIDFLLST